MYDRFPHIMVWTPYRSGHDTRFSTEIDDLNHISARSLDGLNVETSSESCGKSTTDVDREFAIVAVYGCPDGGFTERTYLCPSRGEDRSYSLDRFEKFRGTESRLGGEQCTGDVCPIVIRCGLQRLPRRKIAIRIEIGGFSNRTQNAFVFLSLVRSWEEGGVYC